MQSPQLMIRHYRSEDGGAAVTLARRTLLEVNVKDYSREEMLDYATLYTPDYFCFLSENGHCYVGLLENQVVATGAVLPHRGKEGEGCVLLAIFVEPKLQHQGIGSRILQVLESDSYTRQSQWIDVLSTETAVGFFQKKGYQPKSGIPQPFIGGSYPMEKLPIPASQTA